MATPSGEQRRTESEETPRPKSSRTGDRRIKSAKEATVRSKDGKWLRKRPERAADPDRSAEIAAWTMRDRVTFPPGSGERIRERLAAAPEAASGTSERHAGS